MARKVFFSFHYRRDAMRVSQVRNSWVVRPNGEAQPFLDRAKWEEVKAGGDAAIQRWIDANLRGASVTAVLFGAQTAGRPWVNYEIRRSIQNGKGLLAIDIHDVKDPRHGADVQGRNPLDLIDVRVGEQTIKASQLYPTYGWVVDRGHENIGIWIERAASAAGR